VLPVRSFEDPAFILLATKQGVIKKTELSAFSAPRKKGVFAINIDEGDEVMAARIAHETDQVMLFTRMGMAVRFDQSIVRPIGRVARGVRGISLKSDDWVVSCEVVKGDETILVVCENGHGKRSKVGDFRQTNRGGVGVKSIITSLRNGAVVGAIVVGENDGILLMSSHGQTLRIGIQDVRVMGRSTQGVRLVTLKDGDKLIAVQRLASIGEQPVNE